MIQITRVFAQCEEGKGKHVHFSEYPKYRKNTYTK